ncbi:virulence-associated E family protein [Loktanella sp. F6476L]|uniref:virulence-associated E family protein n=1 Tax=Loktanella sp. F6476L TaxID=2926405 RepID=UPI001FF4E05F|nr:virulence-associated E family protein [Loktanella sp. F6476L]MCK0122549.1 virulence-associated E family protein [Loktanella sp. F6476L]
MSNNEKEMVRFSQGRKNFGKVDNKSISWSMFKDKFRRPTRTGERMREYLKLSEKEQRELKSVDGYWMRAQNKDGIRKRGNAEPSDLISLDFDYATPDFFELAKAGKLLPGVEHFIQTSRRHTEEHPRFRLVIFTAEPVPNDYYPAVSRIVSKAMDPEMAHVDQVSFRPAQMMFMPTACKDGEYIFEEVIGERYDWRSALEEFELLNGDWRNVQNLPKCVGEGKLRQASDKAEDPTTKEGPVGDFCRAYDVPSAIEEFLSDVYTPVDDPSNKPRYTYLGGTTVNGAEVQDDGLFLYSHHGSDPASDQLVNAFDLVRLHKFGHEDEGFDGEDKSPSAYPSWKEMLAFCNKDEGFQKSRMASRYDVEAMFDDVWDEDQIEIEEATADAETEKAIAELVGDIESEYPEPEELSAIENPPSAKPAPKGVDKQSGHIGISTDGIPYLKHKRKRAAKPDPDWVSKLEANPKTGDIANTVANLGMILKHDLRFRDAMAYNEFSQKPVMIVPIRHKIDWLPSFPVEEQNEIAGQPWRDEYDALMRIILETPNGPGLSGWGLTVTDRNLKDAVRVIAHDHKVHPIKETLNSFTHDGERRIERLFIDYLGCPDDAYHRQAAKLFMVAAVARVFEPGHKFDYAPVLVGGQGVRKSTFAKALAMGFFGELTADFSDDQKLAEQMLGKWIMELPELVSMTRSEVEPAKAFISGTHMTVRMSYDRHPTDFPRQTVFMGTTNNHDFLKDDTGNRRFWPILVTVSFIDIDKLKSNLAQLWAEALAAYREMRSLHPYGDLPLFLQGDEANTTANELQEASLRPSEADTLAERIKPILDRKVAEDDFDNVNEGGTPDMERRTEISPAIIIEELGDGRVSTQLVANALGKLGWVKSGAKKRLGSGRKYTAVYTPGPIQLARWADEDSPSDPLV